MRKIRDGVRMIRLFGRLVYEMLKNYMRLNQDPRHNFHICQKICRKIIDSARIHLQVYGNENLPKGENFLLVSNHRCFFDVVFLLASAEETISFVAAKELWNYPLLKKYLSSICCVPLDRYGQDKDKLKESILSIRHSLEKGNLVLFPEGECSYHDAGCRNLKKADSWAFRVRSSVSSRCSSTYRN